MKIQFMDVAGNILSNNATVNIGTRNYVYLTLTVDGEGQSTPIAGNIVKNGKRIGEFNWALNVGETITWYTGDNRPIYVKDGDKIEAIQTSPSSSTVTVNISRIQPNVALTAGNSAFIKAIRPLVPNSTARNGIRSVIDVINIDAPAVYSESNSRNVATIKKYLSDTIPLRDESALILETTANTQSFLSTYVPPTLLTIFNTWDKIAGPTDYYPGGTSPPAGSDAAGWVWNNSTQSIVQTINTNLLTGYISNELVDYYDLDFVVKSGNADDDWNGAIIAYTREDGKNYSLTARVCCDGTNQSANPIANNLTIGINTVGESVLASNSGNRLNTGWAGRTKRLRINRRGDHITVNASDWNSSVINPDLVMTLDLNSLPELARFKGPRKYGYFSHSQADSTFYNIKYYGGVLRNIVIDAQTNTVYRYNPDTGWAVLPSVKAQDVFGAPRILVGQDGKRYQLNLDGTINKIP